MNDPKQLRDKAGWQENPVAPTPVRHQTPLKIDLRDAAVEYEDGRIVAITGTLCVVPHTPHQHVPIDKFLKAGPVTAVITDQHFGGSLSLGFRIIQPHFAPLPSGCDLDKMMDELEIAHASSKPETAKTDGDSGTSPIEPVQQEQGGGKDVSQPAPRLRGDEKEQAPGSGEEGEEIT